MRLTNFLRQHRDGSSFGLLRERLSPPAQESRRRQTVLRGLAHSPLAGGVRGNAVTRCAPETSPCRTAAMQSDGLDLREGATASTERLGWESRPTPLGATHPK